MVPFAIWTRLRRPWAGWTTVPRSDATARRTESIRLPFRDLVPLTNVRLTMSLRVHSDSSGAWVEQSRGPCQNRRVRILRQLTRRCV